MPAETARLVGGNGDDVAFGRRRDDCDVLGELAELVGEGEQAEADDFRALLSAQRRLRVEIYAEQAAARRPLLKRLEVLCELAVLGEAVVGGNAVPSEERVGAKRGGDNKSQRNNCSGARAQPTG